VEKASVVVSLFNQPEDVRQVLESVDASVDFLRRQPDSQGIAVDVVVVDDGSAPPTRQALEEFTRGRPGYHLVLRGQPSNRACARNLGVALAAGDLLFFLDGDGLFLENHLHECLKVFKAHPEVDFVKGQVVLSDPVHPDWVARIANSLVMNLGVRRGCNERAGGFPDLHVFRRRGDRFEHELDIFEAIEDVFYNMKISSVCHGRAIVAPTVRYVRRPGNAYDRQYERFQSEPGHGHHDVDDLYELRLKLAKALIDHEVAAMRHGLNPGVTSAQG
jgi:glycosyltransferase involved in cell wall biosynthesis